MVNKAVLWNVKNIIYNYTLLSKVKKIQKERKKIYETFSPSRVTKRLKIKTTTLHCFDPRVLNS